MAGALPDYMNAGLSDDRPIESICFELAHRCTARPIAVRSATPFSRVLSKDAHDVNILNWTSQVFPLEDTNFGGRRHPPSLASPSALQNAALCRRVIATIYVTEVFETAVPAYHQMLLMLFHPAALLPGSGKPTPVREDLYLLPSFLKESSRTEFALAPHA